MFRKIFALHDNYISFPLYRLVFTHSVSASIFARVSHSNRIWLTL